MLFIRLHSIVLQFITSCGQGGNCNLGSLFQFSLNPQIVFCGLKFTLWRLMQFKICKSNDIQTKDLYVIFKQNDVYLSFQRNTLSIVVIISKLPLPDYSE